MYTDMYTESIWENAILTDKYDKTIETNSPRFA